MIWCLQLGSLQQFPEVSKSEQTNAVEKTLHKISKELPTIDMAFKPYSSNVCTQPPFISSRRYKTPSPAPLSKFHYNLCASFCMFSGVVFRVCNMTEYMETLTSHIDHLKLIVHDLIVQGLFLLELVTLQLMSRWRCLGCCDKKRATDNEPAPWTKSCVVLRLMQGQMLVLSETLTILVQSQAVAVYLVLAQRVLAGELTEVCSRDDCSPYSQEVGDPPTLSVTVVAQKAPIAEWDSLPNDIHVNILQRVEFQDLFRLKVLSKHWKQFIEGDVFRQARGRISEGAFTTINYYIKDNVWHCSGYDLHSKSWRAFPTVSCLPPPDAELFKEYSVCGHGGFMCAEVSKLPNKGELVVFNPLTRERRALPPLLHPRKPVLVHISVDPAKRSYKVIVAGSSAASDEHLSKKVEVFDSSTSKWKEACDLRGPAFGLNEHQAGVCLDGKLYLISFLENDCRRGVIAFDLEEENWVQGLTTPIPWSSYSNILQLVESDGKLFLFSEQESDQSVDHCISELEFPDPEAGVLACRWRNVVQFTKSCGRGLQVYPEHTCVGFGEAKLCIFNTINRDGVVYDIRDGTKCEDLEPPPENQTGDKLFSLNPASFTFEPNFDSDPNFPISHSSEIET